MDAAKHGSRAALRVIAGDAEASRRGVSIELPMPDRYAWHALYEDLVSAGCFGTSAYLSWATGDVELMHATSLPMLEKETALRFARELSTELRDELMRKLECGE